MSFDEDVMWYIVGVKNIKSPNECVTLKENKILALGE
jgi:hypothetical protein